MNNLWGIVGEEAARGHVRENLKLWKDGHNFTPEDLLWMSWSGIPVWEGQGRRGSPAGIGETGRFGGVGT